MGEDDNSDFGPEHKTRGHLSNQFLGTYPVLSQTTVSSMSACEDASPLKAGSGHSVNVSEPLLAGDWDHITPAASNVDFSGVSSISAFNACLNESHRIHCFNSSLNGPVPRIPGFIRGSYPEAISSFAYSQSCGIASAPGSIHLPSTVDQVIEKESEWKKRKCLSDSSPFGLHSSINRIQTQNIEPEIEKDPEEKDEKRLKNEQALSNITRRPNLKQAKEQLQNGSDPKKDYIHVRAKRGQATNSHSLAERVRREKISERMRFLQNLVPGCNKVTGKAVMLDEIINYVQSLQRQVEFLSMKLATVNPELNYDIEQLLSKNILHLRSGPCNDLMYDPGLSSSHPPMHGFISQAATQSEMVIQNLPGCQEVLKIAQFSATPPASGLWDDELQHVFQMGFIPNMPVSGTELPESMKLEQ